MGNQNDSTAETEAMVNVVRYAVDDHLDRETEIEREREREGDCTPPDVDL